MGLFFAVVWVVLWSLISDNSFMGTLIGALVAGSIYGAVMGPWLGRLQRRSDDALGDSSSRQRREAGRAVWRGVPPQDPGVRALSVRLIEHRLRVAMRNRRWTMPIFAFFAILEGWQAVDSGGWAWWLAAAFFTAFFVIAFLEPHRLRRRLNLLQEPRSPGAQECGAGGAKGQYGNGFVDRWF